MVNPQLALYVHDQLKKGYSKDQLRTVLIQSGYSSADIDTALQAAPQKSPIILLTTIFIVMGIVGIATFFFLQAGEELPEALELQMSIQPTTATVKAGDALGFTLSVEGSVDEQGRVRYSVLDITGTDIVSKEEKLRVTPKTIKRDSIPLPHTLALGMYKLAAKLNVKDAAFDAIAPFDVVDRGTAVRIIEESTDSQTNKEEQQVRDIVALAVENPGKAKVLCSEFANRDVADRCHYEAGLTTYDARFCEPVTDYDKRDSCYYNLVLITRNGELCQSITNGNLRSVCEKI